MPSSAEPPIETNRSTHARLAPEALAGEVVTCRLRNRLDRDLALEAIVEGGIYDAPASRAERAEHPETADGHRLTSHPPIRMVHAVR
jgi:hypothetical protein